MQRYYFYAKKKNISFKYYYKKIRGFHYAFLQKVRGFPCVFCKKVRGFDKNIETKILTVRGCTRYWEDKPGYGGRH